MRFVSLDAVEMRCVQNGNCSSDACLDILLLSSRRRLKWFEKKLFFLPVTLMSWLIAQLLTTQGLQ